MTIRLIGLAFVASCLVLLASQGSSAGHLACFSGMKHLVCKPKTSYEKLAKFLYKTADSNRHDDYREAAARFMRERGHEEVSEEFKSMLVALVAVEAPATPQTLCSAWSLRSLRTLAEHMQRDGNCDPETISKPVDRLNNMIIKLIVRAHDECFERIERLFNESWNPHFSSPEVALRLRQLLLLPKWYVFLGYFGADTSMSPDDEKTVGERLLQVLAMEPDAAAESRGRRATGLEQAGAWDADSLPQLLDEHIVKPCIEFIDMQQVITIVAPYYDLLIMTYINTPGWSMAEYLKIPWVRPNYETIVIYGRAITEQATIYAACVKVMSSDKMYLASLMARVKRSARASDQ